MKQEAIGRCLAAAVLLAGTTFAAEPFSFAAFGDAPYTTAANPTTPLTRYLTMIGNINADATVKFGVHIGDIKAGSTRCDNVVYTNNLGYFNMFVNPVVYTPGDNEWTDCHRTNNGGYNPLERLTFLRSVFFTSNMSLGQNPRPLDIQGANPGHALYKENAVWVEGPVVFVTLHQVGSNNNHQQVQAGFTEDEYLARNNANITWLNKAIARANSDKSIKGMVIFSQANPFERYLEPVTNSNAIVYTESGYADFINRLRAFVRSSKLQVLYVGGDTHTLRMDQPLTTQYPGPGKLPTDGTPFSNFRRLEVYGEANVGWVKVTVDPDNPSLFSFLPNLIP